MGFKFQLGKCCGCTGDKEPTDCEKNCTPEILDLMNPTDKEYFTRLTPCRFVAFPSFNPVQQTLETDDDCTIKIYSITDIEVVDNYRVAPYETHSAAFTAIGGLESGYNGIVYSRSYYNSNEKWTPSACINLFWKFNILAILAMVCNGIKTECVPCVLLKNTKTTGDQQPDPYPCLDLVHAYHRGGCSVNTSCKVKFYLEPNAVYGSSYSVIGPTKIPALKAEITNIDQDSITSSKGVFVMPDVSSIFYGAFTFPKWTYSIAKPTKRSADYNKYLVNETVDFLLEEEPALETPIIQQKQLPGAKPVLYMKYYDAAAIEALSDSSDKEEEPSSETTGDNTNSSAPETSGATSSETQTATPGNSSGETSTEPASGTPSDPAEPASDAPSETLSEPKYMPNPGTLTLSETDVFFSNVQITKIQYTLPGSFNYSILLREVLKPLQLKATLIDYDYRKGITIKYKPDTEEVQGSSKLTTKDKEGFILCTIKVPKQTIVREYYCPFQFQMFKLVPEDELEEDNSTDGTNSSGQNTNNNAATESTQNAEISQDPDGSEQEPTSNSDSTEKPKKPKMVSVPTNEGGRLVVTVEVDEQEVLARIPFNYYRDNINLVFPSPVQYKVSLQDNFSSPTYDNKVGSETFHLYNHNGKKYYAKFVLRGADGSFSDEQGVTGTWKFHSVHINEDINDVIKDSILKALSEICNQINSNTESNTANIDLSITFLVSNESQVVPKGYYLRQRGHNGAEYQVPLSQ